MNETAATDRRDSAMPVFSINDRVSNPRARFLGDTQVDIGTIVSFYDGAPIISWDNRPLATEQWMSVRGLTKVTQ